MVIEYEAISPVTGTTTARISLATKHEIAARLSTLGHYRDCPDADAVFSFLRRLADQIRLQKELFFETTYLETGFISRDSMEMINGAIEFLCYFEVYATEMAKMKEYHLLSRTLILAILSAPCALYAALLVALLQSCPRMPPSS